MATTAETLRLSARIIESQPHTRMSAVTAIRLAAGAGRVAHEHAEQVIGELATHLGYGGYRDLGAQIERWSQMRDPSQIVAGLRAAADTTGKEGGPVAEINIPREALDTEPLDVTRDWAGLIDAQQAIGRAMDGIRMGEWDRRIATWLAGWEPTTVATICSWLIRAREAGRHDAQNGGDQ